MVSNVLEATITKPERDGAGRMQLFRGRERPGRSIACSCVSFSLLVQVAEHKQPSKVQFQRRSDLLALHNCREELVHRQTHSKTLTGPF